MMSMTKMEKAKMIEGKVQNALNLRESELRNCKNKLILGYQTKKFFRFFQISKSNKI